MLRNARSIRGYNLLVGDEVVAECQDILVDSSWRKVQYVLARLSHPPEARMILVPTSLAGEPSWDRQGFPLHVAYEDLERMVYTEKVGAGHVRSSHA